MPVGRPSQLKYNVILVTKFMTQQVEHHKVKVSRTAHYYTIGTANRETREVWMIFHGYGQRANRFIHKFDHLDNASRLIVAPEALNKFYWHKAPRVPVANWMTSADRLDEIDDYLAWLDQCYAEILERVHPDATCNILAFSQGTATAWRWLLHRQPTMNKFIQWAGDCPPELDYLGSQSYIQGVEKHFVYGDQDQFVTTEMMDKYQSFFKEQKLDLRTHRFEGTHRIDRDVLSKLVLK